MRRSDAPVEIRSYQSNQSNHGDATLLGGSSQPTGETAVRTTQLGGTGMEISRVGFGAWAVGGGDYRFGWGVQQDSESIAAIHRALELGVNWIDTAAIYGLGRSERVVGRALEGLEQRPYVFTKASRVVEEGGAIVGNLTASSIRREAESSLENLGIDAIDLYQLHQPIPDADIEEGWSALVELRDEGLVRHIGVSNFSVKQLERLRSIAPVETLQPPYSLLARQIESEILPFCEEHAIGVISYSPMASGLLTGAMSAERVATLPQDDWRSRDPRFRQPELAKSLELAARLERIGLRHAATAGAVAVAWVLQNPAVDATIVGFRNPAQVDAILRGTSIDLTSRETAEIERR
jgi:aryl-alcohol dehydrogenase-like predicted oxidoreductase